MNKQEWIDAYHALAKKVAPRLPSVTELGAACQMTRERARQITNKYKLPVDHLSSIRKAKRIEAVISAHSALESELHRPPQLREVHKKLGNSYELQGIRLALRSNKMHSIHGSVKTDRRVKFIKYYNEFKRTFHRVPYGAEMARKLNLWTLTAIRMAHELKLPLFKGTLLPVSQRGTYW